MARTPRWTSSTLQDGVIEFKLSSWKYFSDFVNQELLDYTTYVFRGHGNSAWKLEPTIDRIIINPKSNKRDQHLEKFKFETRGRRGSNPAIMQTENDWWALAQHHGMSTPLLDWSESPFVALYFATSSAYRNKFSRCAIFCLAQTNIRAVNASILENEKISEINDRKPTVKIVRPLSDENSRLVSQRGLFTRGPNNMDMETWIKKYKTDKNHHYMNLIKVTMPTTGMQDCLRSLNRMNINHSTLFPDLVGASEYCNMHLNISKY